MVIESRLVDGWLAVVKVAGELDAYSAPQVREQVEQVIATGAAWLLMDLTEVEYIDSVGLGIMIGAAKRTNDRGGDLAIVAVHPQVLRVFQVSGTKELLNVVGSVAEAQALLAAARARGSEQAARGGEG